MFQCAASCKAIMTRLTGLDTREEQSLTLQDLPLITPLETVSSKLIHQYI